MTIPAREVAASLLLLGFLALAVTLLEPAPGPGPLALFTGIAAAHAALVAPALARGGARWGLLPIVLAAPALAATSFGRSGGALLGSFLIVALAALAGTAARALQERPGGRLYLPSMLLFFAAPFALSYVVSEFGRGDAEAWRVVSPWAAAERVATGGAPPAVCVLLLLAWPVWALARRRA